MAQISVHGDEDIVGVTTGPMNGLDQGTANPELAGAVQHKNPAFSARQVSCNLSCAVRRVVVNN